MTDPSGEAAALKEKELRLKALLSMRLAQEKAFAKEKEQEVVEPTKTKPKIVKTTSPSKSDAERADDRAKLYKPMLDAMDKEKAAEDSTQQNYFDGFELARGLVTRGGKWRTHYDGTSDADRAFKAAVDGTGKSLAKYITDVVQSVSLDQIHFRAGDSSTYPGQLSTFTIRLEDVSGAKFRNTTLAGGVTASEIDIFHAGPGS